MLLLSSPDTVISTQGRKSQHPVSVQILQPMYRDTKICGHRLLVTPEITKYTAAVRVTRLGLGRRLVNLLPVDQRFKHQGTNMIPGIITTIFGCFAITAKKYPTLPAKWFNAKHTPGSTFNPFFFRTAKIIPQKFLFLVFKREPSSRFSFRIASHSFVFPFFSIFVPEKQLEFEEDNRKRKTKKKKRYHCPEI